MALVAAALLSGCEQPGTPSPRAPYSEDADAPDYRCGYDGNGKCLTGERRD